MENKASFVKLLPVLFSFYIVGFCNIVGVATSYVQSSFQLSDAIAGFLPAMVFIWFLFLSAPVTGMTGRLGYKRTALSGMALTLLGMLVPFILYNLSGYFLAFALIGMGNVLLQVSLNPLLASVATGEVLAASLTSGQMLKALSSFGSPFIAAFAMSFWGDWQSMFLVLAVITLLSALWLLITPIRAYGAKVDCSTKEVLALLRTPGILCLFLTIVCVVGADVGMNVVTPKLMMERCGHAVQDATIGSSVYFAFRTLGIFVGTMLLATLSIKRYFRIQILIALVALLILFFARGEYFILTLVGVVGFSLSSIFSVVYALAIKAHPDRTGEISILMVSGMCGGAIIPVVMGVAADCAGSQTGSLVVITTCIIYLIYGAFNLKSISSALLFIILCSCVLR